MPPTSKRPRTYIMEPVPYDTKRLAQYTFPVIVQPKLNGERAWADVVHDQSCTLYSSTGLILPSVPHINQALLSLPTGAYDGELYIHGLPVQQIHSIVSRKTELHPDHMSMQYSIFDLIDPIKAQMHRRETLVDMHAYLYEEGQMQYDKLMFLPSLFAWSIEQVFKALEIYTSQGYEGIVIRNPVAIYTSGKQPFCCMKYKPRKQDLYQIVGFAEEVDQYGQPKGSLGAFILTDPRGNIFKSGSGLTKDQRHHFWMERERYRGWYALIEYPELTPRCVPSQPIFKEIRKDRDEAI